MPTPKDQTVAVYRHKLNIWKRFGTAAGKIFGGPK
jgi:hypothetical protein